MANPVCEVLLSSAALAAPEGEVAAGAGSVVDFQGLVRPLEEGREILGIEYEANLAMARHQLRSIGEAAVEKFSLECVVIHHRTGFVAAGEASVFVRVTSKHRAASFEASRWMMDELKKKVPIWKRPKYKIDQQSSPGANLVSAK